MPHTQFPLFSSHIELAHSYWEKLIQPGDNVIDATCGNGYDSLKLCQILSNSGTFIGIDIQPEAIQKTRKLLEAHLTPSQLSSAHLFEQSHESFPIIAEKLPIQLIVYNLGYLPGSDKSVKTRKASTLKSIQNALKLLAPGGVISLTCYPGHPEGAEEEVALLETLTLLGPNEWNVCHHKWFHSPLAPSLMIIQKKM